MSRPQSRTNYSPVVSIEWARAHLTQIESQEKVFALCEKIDFSVDYEPVDERPTFWVSYCSEGRDLKDLTVVYAMNKEFAWKIWPDMDEF